MAETLDFAARMADLDGHGRRSPRAPRGPLDDLVVLARELQGRTAVADTPAPPARGGIPDSPRG